MSRCDGLRLRADRHSLHGALSYGKLVRRFSVGGFRLYLR